MLSPANPSTTVTLSVDPGPGAHAFSGAALSVHATEEGWSDQIALFSLWTPPEPGLNPGVISGASVTGIALHQSTGIIFREPRPGVLDAWQATFTVTDFTSRDIEVVTETIRFDVFLPRTPGGVYVRESRLAELTEAATTIRVIPAPAALALLGLGALAGLRRGSRIREAPR